MAAYRLWNTPDFEDEVGFDPMRDSRFKDGGRLAQVKHKFAGARSGSELEYQIDRYDQEMRALQTIKNSGPTYGLGFLMELATDPITFVPLIGQWSKGASAMARFKAGAAVSTAYTIPYEMVRRADSMTRTNTESAMTVGSMFILSGAVSAAFGRRGGDFVPDTTPVGPLALPNKALDDVDAPQSTAGAAQRVDPQGDVRRESMRPTRTGIESLPLNPILRLLNSGDAKVVDVATDLTETSGIMLNKIDEGIPMKNDSVTVRFKTTYLPKLLDSINAADDAFLRFRGMTPNSGGVTANAVKLGVERLKNIGDRNATRIEFNRRVGLAFDAW